MKLKDSFFHLISYIIISNRDLRFHRKRELDQTLPMEGGNEL